MPDAVPCIGLHSPWRLNHLAAPRSKRSMPAMDLADHVEECLLRRCQLRRGDCVLVAVSGGCDSMVLLELLHSLAPKHGWRLAVAHLNHLLRGRSSDADERLVVRTARKLGLPVFVERAHVREFAKGHKLSLEMAARRLRHEFLARKAVEWNAPVIALAHHADDQVELFFVRLLRGAGSEGLAGMKWRTVSPVSPKIALVRPLLDVPRAELAQYAAERRLRFREDASNAALDILRNRIRHELLPLLKRRYQPAIAQTVRRLMDIVGEESAVVRAAALAWLKDARRQVFGDLPRAIQRVCLREQLLERGVVPDFDLIERLLAETDNRVSVGPQMWVSRDMAGRVHLEAAIQHDFKSNQLRMHLEGGAGEQLFGQLRLAWKVIAERGDHLPPRAANREFFDADLVGTTITLRHWRPGDRFQPIGMPRPAKLQDLLTNARIPKERRRTLVVAEAADGRLFWVEGLRVGEAFKLTGRTNRRLQWRWQRLGP